MGAPPADAALIVAVGERRVTGLTEKRNALNARIVEVNPQLSTINPQPSTLNPKP
jgi:hypothetical protein